jgi:hypothetical protein
MLSQREAPLNLTSLALFCSKKKSLLRQDFTNFAKITYHLIVVYVDVFNLQKAIIELTLCYKTLELWTRFVAVSVVEHDDW